MFNKSSNSQPLLIRVYSMTKDRIASQIARRTIVSSSQHRPVLYQNKIFFRTLHDASNMDSSLLSTLILLLFSFLTFNGIRYWRCVPYGSKVGSFTWITHRGILLSYIPGFGALTTQHSCQIPPGGSPPHALCHIPFLGRERTFNLLAIAAVLLWISMLSEVVWYWRSDVEVPSSGEKQKDQIFGHGVGD
jgi:hypothetical protein